MEIQNRLGKLIEDVQSMLLVCDLGGNILGMSGGLSTVLGFEEEDFRTSSIRDLAPELENGIQENLWLTDSSLKAPITIYGKMGRCIYSSYQIQLVKEDSDILMIRFGANEVQPNNSQTMKELRRYISQVTHDIKNPLFGIRGHLEILMQNTQFEEDDYSSFGAMLKCCDEMEALITDILEYEKIQAGKMQLEENEFKLRDFSREIIKRHLQAARKKGIQLSLKVADSVPNCVLGDERRLAQILDNLIVNAIKFTNCGMVVVELYELARFGNEIELFFMISDTGIGMSREEIGKLFQEYSQGNNTIYKEFGGTGLGLSICKKLAEMMRGSIHVDSVLGQGSTFAFTAVFKITSEAEISNYSLMEKQLLYSGPKNERKPIVFVEKLVLYVEKKEWENAEQCVLQLKYLCEDKEEAIKNQIFRLKIAVQNENYIRCIEICEKIKSQIGDG